MFGTTHLQLALRSLQACALFAALAVSPGVAAQSLPDMKGDWDNESFVIVDLRDTGTVSGSFANDDTLQLIGYEAGEHALVAAALCFRRAGG